MKLLFDRIDEPGSTRSPVYERRGGYQSLRKALRDDARGGPEQPDGLGHPRPRRRRFPMGRKISFLPHGDMDKYLVCNADESEPGTFKDREIMQKNPHMLIEGILIASYAAGIEPRFIYIRGEYAHQADILEAAIAEARRPGTSASASSAPTTRCRSCSTAAPARTSAARRPGCSTRSRASAATRG